MNEELIVCSRCYSEQPRSCVYLPFDQLEMAHCLDDTACYSRQIEWSIQRIRREIAGLKDELRFWLRDRKKLLAKLGEPVEED